MFHLLCCKWKWPHVRTRQPSEGNGFPCGGHRHMLSLLSRLPGWLLSGFHEEVPAAQSCRFKVTLSYVQLQGFLCPPARSHGREAATRRIVCSVRYHVHMVLRITFNACALCTTHLFSLSSLFFPQLLYFVCPFYCEAFAMSDLGKEAPC